MSHRGSWLCLRESGGGAQDGVLSGVRPVVGSRQMTLIATTISLLGIEIH